MDKLGAPNSGARVYIKSTTTIVTTYELGIETPASGESKIPSRHIFQTRTERKEDDDINYPVCTPNENGIMNLHRFFVINPHGQIANSPANAPLATSMQSPIRQSNQLFTNQLAQPQQPNQQLAQPNQQQNQQPNQQQQQPNQQLAQQPNQQQRVDIDSVVQQLQQLGYKIDAPDTTKN